MFILLWGDYTARGSITQQFVINYKEELNEEQYRVVVSGDGPVLVLAGAGSGKTRTITYRVAYLLEQGVPLENILLVTFTNKAAREMLERAEKLLDRRLTGFWSGTFHSIAVRILKSYAQHLGYKNNFTILDADDAVNLLKRCIVEEGVGITNSKRKFPSPAIIQGIISYSRNAGRTVADVVEERYESYDIFADDFERIARRYVAKKLEGNVMDFDDLLENLARLLETNTEVRARLAMQFRYVLVDEYQDTNTIQASIVKQLSSVHKNVLVVGDDAQSIYSFRAANIQNILDFEKDFPGATIYRLVVNYRSSPDIVSVANSVIKHNKKQFEKELRSMRDASIKPMIVPADTPAEEADFIARRIESLRAGGWNPANICVLFRAVHHAQALEFELARRGIPYEMRGGTRFFERSHVKDTLAWLRIMHNMEDQLAWMRVLGMMDGIGPATAQKIVQIIRKVEKFEDIAAVGADLTGRAKVGWDQCMQIIQALLDAPQRSPQALIETVLKSPHYREYMQAQYAEWQDRYEDLQELARLAARIEDLDSFLAEASLQEQFSNQKDNRFGDNRPNTRLVLSTIHQSKGLEWDAVFVIHMLMPGFPHERALKEPDGIEEERRLFYVAITRARHQLYFTYPQSSGKEYMVAEQPSQFLDEISPELIENLQTGMRRVTTVLRPGASSAPHIDDDEISYEPDPDAGAWNDAKGLLNRH